MASALTGAGAPATVGGTTSPANPYLTVAGETDYDAIKQLGQERAEQTRKVLGKGGMQYVNKAAEAIPSYIPFSASRVPKETRDTQARASNTAQAIKSQAATEMQALQGQADAIASGIELKTAQTIQQMKQYDALNVTAQDYVKKTSDYWNEAINYSDEAVAASNQRMGMVMDRFDKAVSDVNAQMDFATSHALQTQVAGMMSTMREEERNIRSQYGTDSQEFQQFQARKAQSMHVGISNVHSSMAQLRTQIDASLAISGGQLGQGMATLVNYQEKGALDARVARAQQETQTALQGVEMSLQIEALKSAGMDDFVTSITSFGPLSFDSLGWIGMINDVAAELKSTQAINSGMPAMGAGANLRAAGGQTPSEFTGGSQSSQSSRQTTQPAGTNPTNKNPVQTQSPQPIADTNTVRFMNPTSTVGGTGTMSA